MSNTLTCVLQLKKNGKIQLMTHWQPALTCVLQLLSASLLAFGNLWQPALTCVLQLMFANSLMNDTDWQPALTCVLQHLIIQMQGSLSRWQPALTCVLQPLYLSAFVKFSFLATRTHMRIATPLWRAHVPVPKSGNPHSHAYCNDLRTQARFSLSYWQPALTCVLQRFSNPRLRSQGFWQPALTCVLQPQKCTILQHAEFVNAGLFVHGYLLSLGLKEIKASEH